MHFYTEHFGNPKDPACLLIAGAMASARFWSDSFCHLLVKEGLFVIRYDHRDIGQSYGVDWQKASYTLSDLASDALSILDTYGIHQAHCIGHSMGGYIAQMIGVFFPKRTLSICSIAAGPIGATSETDIPLTAQEQAILNQTWAIMLARQDGDSKEATIQSFFPVWEHLNGTFLLDKAMAEAYTRDLFERSQHPIRAGNPHEQVMKCLDLEKFRGVLKTMDVPTLVIHGALDPLLIPRLGASVAHEISGAHLIVVPGMGHMIFNRTLEEKLVHWISLHIHHAFRNMLERNMHLHMTYFAGKVPTIENISESDVTIIRSDIPDDMFNYVLSARLTRTNAASQIAHVIEKFEQHHLPFSWWVSESDTPVDLKKELLRQGLNLKEHDVGMILDLQTFYPQATSDLHFKQVQTKEALKDFADIIIAIGGHPECYEKIYRQIPVMFIQEDSVFQIHSAYKKNKPVVSGIVVFGGNLVGIYYIATIPEERGHGYGTAMMEYLLSLAKQKGYFLAGLEASHKGLNLYKRLGFKEICVFEEYTRT